MGELKIAEISQESKDLMIEHTANGLTIDKVCEAVGLSPRSFHRLCIRDPLFRKDLAEARAMFAHKAVETLRTIYDTAETMTDVQKARGQSENIRWIASKLAPDVYGDRLQVDVKHTIDLTRVLEAASNRLSEALGAANPIDVTPQLETTKKSIT